MTRPTIPELWQAARDTRTRAYAPYSGYQVGAALAVEGSGRMFTGCNVENASYGATICAERNAVLQAVAAIGGLIRITELVLVTREPAVPCGMCLQVLSEFCAADTRIVLATPERMHRECVLSDFLPSPFDSSSLDPHD